ncbi:MAG: 1-acyl-sn-glycerol-3-phosphate acyltransferase [Planctomycetaceae bacterium]|nr:1-acyl-sn-glycerol-3-phosphate acyltransferase [Planctomycetaceae bacterium]
MAQRSLFQRGVYSATRIVTRCLAVWLFRLRCRGRGQVPASGGALICCNHQSNIDPVVIGLCCDRQLIYLARKSLFRFGPFACLIRFYGAISIDRDGAGLTGIKGILRQLKKERLVLMFPEGTRSRDGQIAPFKPGLCALARRARVPLVPVALDGAYDVLPRGRWWPRRTTVRVSFGPPIWPDAMNGVDDEELLQDVYRRIVACHERLRRERADA